MHGITTERAMESVALQVVSLLTFMVFGLVLVAHNIKHDEKDCGRGVLKEWYGEYLISKRGFAPCNRPPILCCSVRMEISGQSCRNFIFKFVGSNFREPTMLRQILVLLLVSGVGSEEV